MRENPGTNGDHKENDVYVYVSTVGSLGFNSCIFNSNFESINCVFIKSKYHNVISTILYVLPLFYVLGIWLLGFFDLFVTLVTLLQKLQKTHTIISHHN